MLQMGSRIVRIQSHTNDEKLCQLFYGDNFMIKNKINMGIKKRRIKNGLQDKYIYQWKQKNNCIFMTTPYLPIKASHPTTIPILENPPFLQLLHKSNNHHITPNNKSPQSCILAPTVPSYHNVAAKVFIRFQVLNYADKTIDQLQTQLRGMRSMMQELNQHLNNKLNKYDMIEQTHKSVFIQNQPEKQSQLLLTQINLNGRTLESQVKEIEELRNRDRDLQQRDYLIQFQERANAVMKQIHQRKKQHHLQGVKIEKLDNHILSIYNPDDPELLYKDIKIIKHQLLFYFKRFHENRQRAEELDKHYEQIREKDWNLTQKYSELTKVAEQRNLLVKANRPLLELKKMTDELVKKIEWQKRKIQVMKRSQRINEDKMERELDDMEKQIINAEIKTDQVIQKNETLVKQIEKITDQYAISTSTWKNISYKFPPIRYQSNPPSNPETERKDDRSFFKPNFKKARNDREKAGTPVQNKFKTIDQSTEVKRINDKNEIRDDYQMSPKKDFRINMKPSMKINKKKGSLSVSQNIEMRELEKDYEKSGQISFHKPSKAKRIMGPMSPQYLKSLQERGKKNLGL